VTTARDASIERIRAAASRVAESHGLELFDLQFRRESIGWVLRVVIDRVGDEGPQGAREEPVGIMDCQRMSHDLGTLLDVEDELGGALGQYTLEVSSPGLDRPLRGEADFRRFTGRLAKVVTSETIGGQTSFAGRITGVEDGIVVITEGRRTHRVPLAVVKRARLDVEF
jgi:ribosome maturation factor RimP